MSVTLQLVMDQKMITLLAVAIAAEMGGNAVTEEGVSKDDILEYMESVDIKIADIKKVLKPYGFKTIKHIEEDSEDLAEILEELKELGGDSESEEVELKGDEVELDSLEKGDENIVLYNEDNEELASGEVEKVLKTAIIVDGEKIKFSDITTVMQTEGDDSSEQTEEITVDLVRETLQAYKREFGTEEYKALLKEYKIKKMADLEAMDENDLAKIFSEIAE